MTLNGVMALILRYSAEFSSFRGPLRISGCKPSTDSVPRNLKVHQLSTTDALCFSR